LNQPVDQPPRARVDVAGVACEQRTNRSAPAISGYLMRPITADS